MRLPALVAGLLLLVPGMVSAAGPTPKQELAQIEQSTVSIRQLQPKRAVKTSFLPAPAFAAAFNTELHTFTPDASVALNQRESVLLGLLRRTDSLRHIYFRDTSAQIAGFYDYHQQRLYVRNDDNQAFGPERYVIAHEYTHALQDQHYHLEKLQPDQFPLPYRNSDIVAAHHALIEGDAVLTETLFIRQTYSRSDLKALIKIESQPATGPTLPRAFQRQFAFPYTTGVDFVNTLYRTSGIGGVDAAYRRLPSSTYEIMHPDAYARHWKPADVAMHAVQGLPDWQQTDDDVFGAFGYNLLLWQFIPHKQATAITDAYRGDRYLFLQKGSDSMFLFRSVWNDAAAAKSAKLGLLAALKTRFRHAKVHAGAQTVLLNGNLAVYLRSEGARLTMAYAPTEALAIQLGTATTT